MLKRGASHLFEKQGEMCEQGIITASDVEVPRLFGHLHLTPSLFRQIHEIIQQTPQKKLSNMYFASSESQKKPLMLQPLAQMPEIIKYLHLFSKQEEVK